MDFETLQTVTHLEKAKKIALKAMETGDTSRYYQDTVGQYFWELGARVVDFPGVVSRVSNSSLIHTGAYDFTQTEGLAAALQAVKKINETGVAVLSGLAIRWTLDGNTMATEAIEATHLQIHQRDMENFETSLNMLDDLIKQGQVTFNISRAIIG